MSLENLSPGKLKILKAVSTLLEDPSARITINRIAHAIHVTEAAIYRHYRSKEDIFNALVSYMEANMMPPLEEVSPAGVPAALERVFSDYMDFFASHPGLARLFLGDGASEANGLAERIKVINARIRARLAQIMRSAPGGTLARGVAPEQAVELLYGLFVGAAMAQAFDFPQIATKSRWQAFARAVFAEEAASRAA